jgi:hypothetical protein
MIFHPFLKGACCPVYLKKYMKPSDDIIEKFRKAYIEEFNEEISKEEAYAKFLRLTNFLRVILKPKPTQEEPAVDQPSTDDILNHNS